MLYLSKLIPADVTSFKTIPFNVYISFYFISSYDQLKINSSFKCYFLWLKFQAGCNPRKVGYAWEGFSFYVSLIYQSMNEKSISFIKICINLHQMKFKTSFEKWILKVFELEKYLAWICISLWRSKWFII